MMVHALIHHLMKIFLQQTAVAELNVVTIRISHKGLQNPVINTFIATDKLFDCNLIVFSLI